MNRPPDPFAFVRYINPMPNDFTLYVSWGPGPWTEEDGDLEETVNDLLCHKEIAWALPVMIAIYPKCALEIIAKRGLTDDTTDRVFERLSSLN